MLGGRQSGMWTGAQALVFFEEFSKETKIMKMIKAFIRSKVRVEEAKYMWKIIKLHVEEHRSEPGVSYPQ